MSEAEKVKTYYEESYRFVCEGLNLEERRKSKEAVLCYEKGLRIISSGLSIRCDGQGQQWDKAREMQRKMTKTKEHIESRLEVLQAATQGPSAPLMDVEYNSATSEASSATATNGGGSEAWENATELISIDEGVRLFHVDQNGSVSTWSMPCQLKIYQLVNDHQDRRVPPAFLQCGEWIYPMDPGRSPVLKSNYRTYMFPDVTLVQSSHDRPACVGLVLADIITEKQIVRFERILTCYCDFRKHSTEDDKKSKPPRPPPPYSATSKEPAQPASVTTNTEMSLVPVNTERALVPVRPDEIERSSSPTEDERHWTEKVSEGIMVGAEWISWGLGKGAQITSRLVEKGAAKLREKMQPNEEPTQIDPKVAEGVKQVQTVTGAAVQVSGFLVNALVTLTVELGKQLAPVVRDQGAKVVYVMGSSPPFSKRVLPKLNIMTDGKSAELLPEKYKVQDGTEGRKTMDDVIKVAAVGVQGFATVFNALEEAGKVLYRSVSKATVETVNHKYGEEASDVTEDAMGAAGNTALAYWNVKKLGAKAIAKRAAKDTGKAMLFQEEEKINAKDGKRYLEQ